MTFSPLDIAGAAIGLVYIFSEYRANRWFWPASLLMSAFYAVIDFNAHYYANASICVYNFVMSIYGILVWRGLVQSKHHDERPITSCPKPVWKWIVLAVVLLSVVFWRVLLVLGESNYPVVDGISAALSVVGMVMCAQKWWQQWFCWMIVEPLMMVLFLCAGMYASAALYAVYEVFCILGVVRWKKESI